jgi:hypothetical protein
MLSVGACITGLSEQKFLAEPNLNWPNTFSWMNLMDTCVFQALLKPAEMKLHIGVSAQQAAPIVYLNERYFA